MISWIVEGYDGKQFTLPHPTRWQLDYGLGNPCDAFSLRCPWRGGQEAVLETLHRVIVKDETEIIFTGLVDECECRWSEDGAVLELSGRGMQALLMDNQATGVDFSVLTQEELLRRYVTPYGIKTIGGRLPAVAGFSVTTGSSCWQILSQFARYHAGITPRFDKLGRLELSPLPTEASRVLQKTVPMKELVIRHKRYGVLSEMTVVNRVTKVSQNIRDEKFIEKGGCASRAITMPRKTGSQAMRYNGAHQIALSRQALLRVEITVAEPFLASPGEVIEIKDSAWPIVGRWRVVTSRVSLGEGGYQTRLVLTPPDVLL